MGEARRRKLADGEPARSALPEPAGLWPLANATALRQLTAWFLQRGIDPTRPGLHDTQEFIQAEQRDPKALNFVARLVEARAYTADDLHEAERKVKVAALAVAGRVARDGRPGLCVVASCALSRMLDELRVWNYTAKTNLAIRFPPSVSAEPRYFYSIDEGHFAAPHAIVVAPPLPSSM